MEITKTVPVTIEIDDDDKRDCSGNCCFNVEGCYCARYDVTTINGRNDGCISEFGTGEKPAVVPWENSNIGDVVKIAGRNYKIHSCSYDDADGPCCKCAFQSERGENCPYSLTDNLQLLCFAHSSGDIYFTEVKE
jgi:hypothetical protein